MFALKTVDPHFNRVTAFFFRATYLTTKHSPHFNRVTAESFYTPILPHIVAIVAFSRGGACPTDRGSTLTGTPLN
jgi:hypothetical protein